MVKRTRRTGHDCEKWPAKEAFLLNFVGLTVAALGAQAEPA